MARLCGMRFSICCAMFSATRAATMSGLTISSMSSLTFLLVNFSTPSRISLTAAPLRPITTPGRAVCTVNMQLVRREALGW